MPGDMWWTALLEMPLPIKVRAAGSNLQLE